ncbi:MAG: tRNA lysidine(34) synthetase TilS [Verrucomicrobiales bacterium]
MDLVAALRDWPWPFRQDEPVLMGVSGGVDSMVLGEVMVRLGIGRLVVCHMHHGLRGVEADADEALVRSWAAGHGCECEVGHVDVAGRAAARRQSVETAGREARREFFREVAARRGARHVALAHHADDQVETLLMHLLRGAGTHGLGGMRAVTDGRGLMVVRPLLAFWRREIEAWAVTAGLAWRVDASNRCLTAFRNRIRHGALPTLEAAAGRDIKEALRRAAMIAAEDDAELAAAAAGHRTALESPVDGALSVAGVRSLSPAIARRVIHGWLEAQGVPEVGFALVEAVWAVARSDRRPASCNTAGGRRVRRRAGRLFLDTQR